jgi:hypothetical protein
VAENSALTEEQLKAVTLLASKKTWSETISALGIARSTLFRWSKMEAFQVELERRKSRALEMHHVISSDLQDQEIQDFYNELREYRQALVSAYRTRISRGLKILQKVGRRLDDLPEESIQPRDVAGLLNSADSMLEKGLNQWAELLAVDELLSKMQDGTKEGS